MAGITILIEYPWTSTYSPWLSSSYPWATVGANEVLKFTKEYWTEFDLSWDGTFTTWGDSMIPAPKIITGTGISVSPAAESMILSVPLSTIIEGTGINVQLGVESFALSTQIPSIVEGQGKTVSVAEQILTFSSETPEIFYDYAIFPESIGLNLSLPIPKRIGNLYDPIAKPSSEWSAISQPDGIWTELGTKLWSPYILPWKSDFYPWLQTYTNAAWTSLGRTGKIWDEYLTSWDMSTKNWEGYNQIAKVSTNYSSIKKLNR